MSALPPSRRIALVLVVALGTITAARATVELERVPPIALIEAPTPAPSQPGERPSEAHRLARMHDAYRARNELGSLAPDDSLTKFARERAAEMAAAENVWHSRSLPAGSRWQVVGENVGRATTVEEVFDGFVRSASHRANLLRPGFRFAGIGVAVKAGARYVAVIYAQPWPGPAPSQARPATVAAAAVVPPVAEPVAVQALSYLIRLIALEG